MRSFLSLGTFGCQLLHRDRLHVYFFQFSLCLNCQIGRPAGGCLGVHRCMHYKWHHFSSCVYTTEFSNGGLLFDFAEQTYLGTYMRFNSGKNFSWTWHFEKPILILPLSIFMIDFFVLAWKIRHSMDLFDWMVPWRVCWPVQLSPVDVVSEIWRRWHFCACLDQCWFSFRYCDQSKALGHLCSSYQRI